MRLEAFHYGVQFQVLFGIWQPRTLFCPVQPHLSGAQALDSLELDSQGYFHHWWTVEGRSWMMANHARKSLG